MRSGILQFFVCALPEALVGGNLDTALFPPLGLRGRVVLHFKYAFSSVLFEVIVMLTQFDWFENDRVERDVVVMCVESSVYSLQHRT